jgi:murein DD-endopeptidase MepM/ murein hydrolase activator NlpD
MRSPRFTILVANRNTGVVRRLTLSRRVMTLSFGAVLVVPLLIGLGAGGGNPGEVEALRLANESLLLENESYRAATGELAVQISSLQTALTQLGEQTQFDPAAREAIDRQPAVLRSRATGGAVGNVASLAAKDDSPDGTFELIKDLLGALEHGLASVKTSRVEDQQARALARPSIWPLVGWLSSGFGYRRDPFDGKRDFHSGLDIAADRGTPVRATADGRVESAEYNGNYGNSVVIAHGYGVSTRFGHLSGFAVAGGRPHKRGQHHHAGSGDGLRRCDRPRDQPTPALRDPDPRGQHRPAAAPGEALALFSATADVPCGLLSHRPQVDLSTHVT